MLDRREYDRNRHNIYDKIQKNKIRKTQYDKIYIRKYQRNLRLNVINHYGGVCECCGEHNIRFLTIDHINNDGANHRKIVGSSNIYSWLVKNEYPNGFRVLCMNCNWGRAYNGGICPHKTLLDVNS